MKNLFVKSAALSAVLVVAACSSGVNYDPIIDGKKGMTYYSDLSVCQEYAKQKTVTPTGAFLGAATGALVKSGGDRGDIAQGAAVGAGLGATGDVAATIARQKSMIRTCMRGRGYKVLD